ncbi:hypothetical protein B5P41_33820, partial [Bacillus sp. SRB_28]
MTNDKSALFNLEPAHGDVKVELADRTTVPVHAFGRSRIQLADDDHILSNVLYVPDLNKSLYSPGQATSEGYIFLLTNDRITIYHEAGFRPPDGKDCS